MRLAICLLPLMTNACSLLEEYHDNAVEEFVEAAIEHETGVKIDITGSSIEVDVPSTQSVSVLKF